MNCKEIVVPAEISQNIIYGVKGINSIIKYVERLDELTDPLKVKISNDATKRWKNCTK